MKVTKSYIKQLVKEELNKVLKEVSLEDDIGTSAIELNKRAAEKDAGFGGNEGTTIDSRTGIVSRVLFRRTGASGDNRTGTPHLILHVIEAEGAEELKGAYYWMDYHKKYDTEKDSFVATKDLKGIAHQLSPKKLTAMIGVGGAFKKVTDMSQL